MTFSKEAFIDYNPLDKPVNVETASGASIQGIGEGSVVLDIVLEGRNRKVLLTNVLHVPRIAGSLISVSQLEDRGLTVRTIAGPKHGILIELKGKIVALASRIGKSYIWTQRLSWARREKLGKRDWNKLCWSDEVTFEVGHNSRTIYISHRAGKKVAFLDNNLKPSFKSGRTSVSVWSCYCNNEMGPLVILEEGGRMTATRYLETVKNYFVPFYKRMVRKYSPRVVMQEDNALWHTAKMVRAYLQLQGESPYFSGQPSYQISL
jgi:hypothetical protein